MSKYTELIKGYPFGKPKFERVVDKTTRFYLDIQEFFATLPDHFNLDKAKGKQLDIIGQWVGRSRYLKTPISGVFFSFDDSELGFDLGNWFGRFDSEIGLSELDDDTYRVVLKAQIAANNWDGTNEQLIALLTLFFGENYRIFFHDIAKQSRYFTGKHNIPTNTRITHFKLDSQPSIEGFFYGATYMQESTRIVAYLAMIGAAIGLGKLLQTNQPLTWRLALGRMITGSAVSTLAGLVLIHIPDMPFPAVMALGSALGIMGAEFVEQFIKKLANKKFGDKK